MAAAVTTIQLSRELSWSAEACSEKNQSCELRVTTIHDPPFVLIQPQPDGSNWYGGFLYDIWKIVAERLSLRFRMVIPEREGFGSLSKNGTWTGMVGELAYGRADVALSTLYMRTDRQSVVDFIDTVPVQRTGYSFYVRQGNVGTPALTAQMFSSLLKPLHANVWWTLLVALFVLSGALRITLRFNHERAERRRTVEEMSWCSCLLHCFLSLVGQGWTTTPNSLAARIITITTWVLSTIIFISYTTNLISYLTVDTPNRPISSLKEFSEQAGWRFAIQPGHAALNDWKVSDDPYERELYWRSENQEGFLALGSTNETLSLAIEPKVLSYVAIRRLLFAVGMEGCRLVPLLGLPTTSKNQYIAIAKGQRGLRKAISLELLRMTEAGLLSRQKTQWKTSQDTCSPPAVIRQLTAGDLMALLMIPPLALAISAAILALECIWYLRSARETAYGLW